MRNQTATALGLTSRNRCCRGRRGIH